MFENIRIVKHQAKPCSAAEVDTAAAQLGVRFPLGYREYVTRFGAGVLGGTLVRIYPPSCILRDLGDWRARIDEYWFWDKGKLKKAEALASVIVGDTMNGDELIFHPRLPDRLYVLPRDFEEVFFAGEGFPAAIEWLCSSGVLTAPFSERNFEPDV